MRVVECNRCGEVIAGSGDDELTDRLVKHFEADHGGAANRDELRDRVERCAYDASDS